jgi:RNA polymerase sigma-70 factor (ECF subfamily)
VISTVADPTQTDVGETYGACSADLIRYATVLVGPTDAQDVVSDAVLNVFASVKDWSAIANQRGYLFRAVLNQATSHQRSSGRRRRREQRASEGARRDAPAPDAASIDAHRALTQLSPQQRAVVFLTYWEDLTPPQIANLLDIGEGSVKKQLARAREQLRRILDA